LESRTAADVVFGALAVLALLGLLAGVPYALVRFLPSPVPEHFSLELLTQQVGWSVVLNLLVILVWLAWAQLVACILVELWSGIRRVGVPAQVPFARGPQALVHRLVTAALLLFTAATVIAPVVGAVANPPAPVSVQADARQQAPREAEPLTPVKVKKVYSVQPPEGRHHESLWEIAEKCLGEGRRYREIYELNRHREQPDGTKLHIASLIRPGWVLEMPHDARNVHIVSADESRRETLAEHPGKPVRDEGRVVHDGKDAVQVHDRQADPEQTMDVRVHLAEERPAGERNPAEGRHQDADLREHPANDGLRDVDLREHPANDGLWDLDLSTLPEYVAGASLAAAGLLAALGRRRREQLWSRAFGRRVAAPTGPGALAERAMLLGADADGTRVLDLGLRHLSKELAAQDRTPPTVYGAFLTSAHLDLWIHPADKDAPEPWTCMDDGRLWRLPVADALRLTEHALAGTLAPYPGLVSLGTTEGGRVLIDLEAAHGIVNLAGPPPYSTAALAAVAVELAVNHWSDHMNLVLVGFGADLTLIAPERITSVNSLAEALPALEARTSEVRRALAAVGADSVLTGRSRGEQGEAWMPTYLLSAVPPTPEESARLAELAKTGTRLSSGYLVAGESTPGAVWQWRVDEHGRASVPALGLNVKAQLLPEDQYSQIIDLFTATTRRDGPPLPDPEPSGAAARQLYAGFQPLVDVRLIGPPEVTAPHPLEDDRLALCQELIAYVATHPGGVHPRVLAGALWPRGVEESVRDTVIDRAMDWLGEDRTGRPNLHLDAEGRLHLGDSVRIDWEIFKELTRRARLDPQNEAAMLDHALHLVRGPLLANVPNGRYSWLAGDPVQNEVIARVSDAAHRLWESRMAASDAEGAITAVLAGLRVSEGDEALWRDLLRAAHATGDTGKLHFWTATLRQRAAGSQYWGRLVPETEALIEELAPSQIPERAAG
jgi:hypothetical protein